MSDLAWLVIAVALVLCAGAWIAFTSTRLDRLHTRVEATYYALDAALVRRSAALLHVADIAGSDVDRETGRRLSEAASASLAAGRLDPAQPGLERIDRERVENSVSRAVNELGALRAQLPERLHQGVHEITESSARVLMARRFYNDAVRDTRNLRGRTVPRLLHLARHHERPDFFDIDDSTTMALTYIAAPATSAQSFAGPSAPSPSAVKGVTS